MSGTSSIKGQVASRPRRFFLGLMGTLVILAVLGPLSLTGTLDSLEFRGLDWLERHWTNPAHLSPDIVMVYVDQKSIDFIKQSMHLGWPWPRDLYGLIAGHLKAGGAKALIFDSIFSEPSVYAETYGDDATLAQALADWPRVILSFTLHEQAKEDAAESRDIDQRLNPKALTFSREGGPAPKVFASATLPIPPFEKNAWGLGFINIEPDSDGVVRRMRPLAEVNGRIQPSLALEAYLKILGIDRARQTDTMLEAGSAELPLDRNGQVLVKFYGGLSAYPDYAIAAVIQGAMDRMAGRPVQPEVDAGQFRDKIVFIGAKAAGLFDLRATPRDRALPGVNIHAAFLNNLMANDFLHRASPLLRGLILVALLVATLAVAVLIRSALWAAGLSLGLSGIYVGLTIMAFHSHNTWVDLPTPITGQILVFTLAGIVNYYGEGRQKKAVKNAFSRYLSPQVVDQLMEHPELLALGGARREMTCFFSDVAGFTSISEALSPEDLVTLLNRYLSKMTRAIMARGGTVDKFEGDAIMAFWGAPLIQEDHALRACLSALEQQRLMAEFRQQTLDEGLPELKVRMGINTGPMIVGNMGSEERFDYTVMGDAVNLASRLEGANKAYGSAIMISETTHEQVRGLVEVRELDLLRVKGKEHPIRVFELVAKSGDLSPEKARVLSVFQEGLELYRAMDFLAAEKTFQAALDLDPQDAPASAYVERCRAYRKSPPPPDWDRVFTMTTK